MSSEGMTTKNDILPDVLDYGLDVIFCGTAPSKTSAVAGAYYANERNRFWSILCECKLTDIRLEPSEYLRLKDRKIGLTDLCKLASGSDDVLHLSDFLIRRAQSAVERYEPHFLAFTSKAAAAKFLGRSVVYGKQESFGASKVYALPTTSPRHGDVWWSKNVHYWHQFADDYHRSIVGVKEL